MSKTTHLLLLVAPGRLVRKHIAYQNIEGIAKKGKCNCGRMLKDAEGNCWHDKSRKLYPYDQDHVVPQTPSRLSRANQEVHLDSACAAQLGCLQLPISGITASICDSTNCTMSPSITSGVTGSIRTTRTGSSKSRSWQCITASGAEML